MKEQFTKKIKVVFLFSVPLKQWWSHGGISAQSSEPTSSFVCFAFSNLSAVCQNFILDKIADVDIAVVSQFLWNVANGSLKNGYCKLKLTQTEISASEVKFKAKLFELLAIQSAAGSLIQPRWIIHFT